MPANPPTAASLPRAGLLPRLMALLYDLLVVAGLLFFAAVLSTVLTAQLLGVTDSVRQSQLSSHPLHTLYLLLWWFGYYALSWRRGGQTIGMKAWRLQVRRLDGTPLRFKETLIRFGAGLMGMTNLTLLLTRSGLALHDKLSMTEVVTLPQSKP